MAKPTTTPLSPPSAGFDDEPVSEALALIRKLEGEIGSQSAPQSASEPGNQHPDRSAQVLEVGIDRLHSGPGQPRRRFCEESLGELAASLEKTGVLQPIIVRRHGTLEGDFEIVAGERRWRAARLARLARVPVIVRDLSDVNALEVALVENVQREDLTPIEIAEAYQRLLSEFHYTQESLSRLLGKSRSHVSNTLRLLNLPHAVRDLVQEGQLSAGHARALLNSEDPVQLAKRVVSQKLSVRKAERLTKTSIESTTGLSISRDARDPTASEEPVLSALLGRKVTVISANESYTVTIKCESPKDLYDLVGKLKATWEHRPIPREEREGDTHGPAQEIAVKRNIDAYGREPKPLSERDLARMAAELGDEYP